jgi:hypothetical protein
LGYVENGDIDRQVFSAGRKEGLRDEYSRVCHGQAGVGEAGRLAKKTSGVFPSAMA